MSAFDLRVYHVVEGQIGTLERVLREVALPIMTDHDMRAIRFWADPDGRKLYQITEHQGLETITADWDRLHADPRWRSGLQTIRQDRSAVEKVETISLTNIDGLPPSGSNSAG